VDPLTRLLMAAYRNRIIEANAEAGLERIAVLCDGIFNGDAFREALAAALRERLIFDPVRLPEGALQCHWQLELTPAGVARCRELAASDAEVAQSHGEAGHGR
jgi:hypothetical protein